MARTIVDIAVVLLCGLALAPVEPLLATVVLVVGMGIIGISEIK
jgi:hypothetical protein